MKSNSTFLIFIRSIRYQVRSVRQVETFGYDGGIGCGYRKDKYRIYQDGKPVDNRSDWTYVDNFTDWARIWSIVCFQCCIFRCIVIDMVSDASKRGNRKQRKCLKIESACFTAGMILFATLIFMLLVPEKEYSKMKQSAS